jgi:UDP-N-acetyl-D-glucosamine dehydrogenase
MGLYGKAIDKVVSVSSSHVVEATNLLENIFRSVNIAFVNERKRSTKA